MKNHRCEGSLKNEISIRFSTKYENLSTSEDCLTWRLFENAYDWDYGSYYQHHVAKIKYCPFCGIRLED